MGNQKRSLERETFNDYPKGVGFKRIRNGRHPNWDEDIV
nr:MAG TPA: hypothetical protein [Caudoviricetes sp.]DAH97437.1 MAG TPA: hypothetical protein [Bacteriophage sp.]